MNGRDNKGQSRRRLLGCMAWAGTGLVWMVAGGVPVGLGLEGLTARIDAALAADASLAVFAFLPRGPSLESRRWDGGGLVYWAVSDVDSGGLEDFQRAFLGGAR